MSILDKIFGGRKPHEQDDIRQRDAPMAMDAEGDIVYEEDLVGYIKQELERRRNERGMLELQWTLNANFVAGHQVRNTVVQLVDIKERIAAHIHQLALAVLRLQAVLYRFHTMLSSRQNLHILLVGESIAEMRHREDTMLHLPAILIEEDRRLAALFRIRHNREFILLQVLSHIPFSISRCIRNLSRRSIRSSRILRCHERRISRTSSRRFRFCHPREDDSYQRQKQNHNTKTL